MVAISHLGSDLLTFLGLLAIMGVRTNHHCALGDAETLPYVPRVTVDNLVISPARWILRSEDASADRIDAWRRTYRVPRLIRIVESVDQALLADIDTDLGRDQLLLALRRAKRQHSQQLVVEEAIAAASPWVAGGDGLYVAEFVVSLEVAADAVPARERNRPVVHYARSAAAKGPDHGWLYYKIFCDQELQDHVLRRVVRPLFAELTARYEADRRFFLRYADPKPHLRVRVRVAAKLQSECSAVVWSTLLKAVQENEIDDVQQAVYHPELLRYGGPAGLELAEELFDDNSSRVLSALAARPSDDVRIAGALKDAYRLVDGLLDPAGMRAWLTRPRGRHAKLPKEDWERVRQMKAELLARHDDGDEPRAFPHRARLHGTVGAVAGTPAASDFVESIVHMNFNRYGFAHREEHRLREMLWHVCTGIGAVERQKTMSEPVLV